MRHRTRLGGLTLVFSSFALVEGLDAEGVQALVRRLDERYPAPTPSTQVRGALADGRTILETHLPLTGIRSQILRFLLRFNDRFSHPWTHFEGGACLLRVEAPDGDEADELAARAAAYLAKHGGGEVRLRDASAQERATFDVLQRLAAGEASKG